MFKNFVGVHRHIPHENLEIYMWFKLLYYETPCIRISLDQRSFRLCKVEHELIFDFLMKKYQ